MESFGHFRGIERSEGQHRSSPHRCFVLRGSEDGRKASPDGTERGSGALSHECVGVQSCRTAERLDKLRFCFWGEFNRSVFSLLVTLTQGPRCGFSHDVVGIVCAQQPEE